MKDVKDVIAVVSDTGPFVESAVRLARDYKKVYYCAPGWLSSFPRMNESAIGYGLENIEVVKDIFDPRCDEADLYIFPDVGQGTTQTYLESQGKAVWGSRMGEEMELYRDKMREHMKKLGLPVPKYTPIKGVKALRDHLREHEKQWVKINFYRGMMETFFAHDYKSVEPKLDELEYQFGAFKYIVEFMVDEDLPDMVETGVDTYIVDGKRPSKLITGIEIKDKCYLEKFVNYNDIPEVVTRFDNIMTDTFKKYGYRGFYSTEVRVKDGKTPYMIDLAARLGSPPSELYFEQFTNISEIIWAGANGEVVDPTVDFEWGAELLIHSAWADMNWQPVDFPEEHRRSVKLRYAAKINDRYYTIPQKNGVIEVGAVIGLGHTMQEAIDKCKKVAESVNGYYIDTYPQAFDNAEESIEKLKKDKVSAF